MIVVTGGAGFIGSSFVWKLNQEGVQDIIVVDDAKALKTRPYLNHLKFKKTLSKEEFLGRLRSKTLGFTLESIVHMGACSSTTETDKEYLWRVNTNYSKTLAEWSLENSVRFIYASSGATYGDGTLGFSDEDHVTTQLKPLNLYGESKQAFDLWALERGWFKHMVGLKFFNVYGPNEYHKGEMASVILKSFTQIQKFGLARLFRSYNPHYRDGEQLRDFIYVKDCVDVLWWLLQHNDINGLYNLGSGKARTWNDLVAAVFKALGRAPSIEYFDIPNALKEHYQYFTEAHLEKLIQTSCPVSFTSLEVGIKDYVQNYLMQARKNF